MNFWSLLSRINAMIVRAMVVKVDDSGQRQRVHAAGMGAEWSNAERLQQYGFQSFPPDVGSEALLIFPKGDWEHPLVIAIEKPADRPAGMASGDSMQWAKGGGYVHVKADGSIKVSTTVRVEVEAKEVKLLGNGIGVNVESDTSVKLTSGTSSIELTPGLVEIKGDAVNIVQA